METTKMRLAVVLQLLEGTHSAEALAALHVAAPLTTRR
jgi:hypothetical protein